METCECGSACDFAKLRVYVRMYVDMCVHVSVCGNVGVKISMWGNVYVSV